MKSMLLAALLAVLPRASHGAEGEPPTLKPAVPVDCNRLFEGNWCPSEDAQSVKPPPSVLSYCFDGDKMKDPLPDKCPSPFRKFFNEPTTNRKLKSSELWVGFVNKLNAKDAKQENAYDNLIANYKTVRKACFSLTTSSVGGKQSKGKDSLETKSSIPNDQRFLNFFGSVFKFWEPYKSEDGTVNLGLFPVLSVGKDYLHEVNELTRGVGQYNMCLLSKMKGTIPVHEAKCLRQMANKAKGDINIIAPGDLQKIPTWCASDAKKSADPTNY